MLLHGAHKFLVALSLTYKCFYFHKSLQRSVFFSLQEDPNNATRRGRPSEALNKRVGLEEAEKNLIFGYFMLNTNIPHLEMTLEHLTAFLTSTDDQ